MNIQEDYVSFEISKLLKEKGFDEECEKAYISSKAWSESNYESPYINKSFNEYFEKDCCTKPTLQMAMKWLRNNFHLEIYPFHDAIQENNDWWYRIEHHSKGCSLIEHESDIIYKTYEQASEAAIKYCLENLI